MFQLIKNYVSKLTISDIDEFLKKNDIVLNSDELNFTYKFIVKNYEAIYANPNIDLTKFKEHYSSENFSKLMKLVNEAKIKYAKYLD